MLKLIFCNLDLLKNHFDSNDYDGVNLLTLDYKQIQKKRDKFMERFKQLSNDTENQVYFYSRNKELLKDFEQAFHSHGFNNFNFMDRSSLKDFAMSNRKKNNYFVFVGGKNKDFELAVNTSSLFIVPTWLPLEDRPQRYGVHVDTVKQLYKFILTLNNQNTWYSVLEVDSETTCYSLMDARYGAYAKTIEEKDMLLNFQKLLKEGTSRNYYQILLYHFLAGMTNSMNFDDIELFGMIPSSDCSVNRDLFSFMTQVRQLKGKQLPKRDMVNGEPEYANLLIRHTKKQKAHIGRNSQERMNLGGKDEFATLYINPYYKNRIEKLREKGKFNVCIFDDYMTHGNSFNSVRNLLENLGANKIVFVSLGLFRNPFQKRDYTIRGSVYGKDYSWQLDKTEMLSDFDINELAKREVSDLYDIFNS